MDLERIWRGLKGFGDNAADEAAPCHGVRQQPESQHGGACAVAEAGAGRELVRDGDERQVARPVGSGTECVFVRDAVSPDAGGSQEQRPGIVSCLSLCLSLRSL